VAEEVRRNAEKRKEEEWNVEEQKRRLRLR
jgi:hypothetical protein